MGANAVIATLWEASDNSTPVLMREFYRNREKSREWTKAEGLRQAQLSLLTGTVAAKPLADVRKRAAAGKIKLMVVPDDSKELRASAGTSQVIYVARKDAPPYERRKASPFAHPYYWASFILTGNWR
jgi:CHAT domain-containing protein